MANENYTTGFKIISEFDPSGTKAAQQGLNNVTQAADKTNQATTQASAGAGKLGQSLKTAVGPATALTGALGQSSGGMGKVMQSLAGIMGSFALGPVGLVVAGITAIIGTIRYFKDAAKQAREEFNKQIEEYQSWKGEQIANKYKRIADAINSAAQAQTALNGTLLEYNSAVTSKGLAQQGATNNASINATKTPEAKRIAQAEAALANARITGRGNVESATINRNNANTELDRATQAESSAYSGYVDAQRAYKNSGGDAKLKNQKLMEEAEKAYIAAQQAKNVADQKLINANMQLEAVTLSNANALAEAEQEVKQANEAYAELVYKLGLESEQRETMANDLATKQAEEIGLKDKLNKSLKDESKARDNAAKFAAMGDRKANTRNGIAAMGASDFINGRLGKRDGAEDEENQNKRDANRAGRLHAALDRGSKISKTNQNWLSLYDEWAKAKGQGGAGGKEVDEAKKELKRAEAEQQKQGALLSKIDDVTTAIKDLQSELLKANTVK